MRDDELRERLLDRNPWWRATAAAGDLTGWTGTDPTLLGRAPYDLGYRSGLLDDVADGPIDDTLVVVRGPRRVGNAPRVWLLDEVTGIRDWTQTLKCLRDNTELGADTVVCTESSWDEEAEVERDLFAGRAGSTAQRRSRILHPMSFRDVIAVTGRSIPLPERLAPWELQSEAARAVAGSLEFFLDELDLAWQSYLTSGGFPRAVAEHHNRGEVSDWCHQVDENGRQVPGAQSKLYLCDPVLAWLGPRLRSGLPRPDFTRLTEACTATALARTVDRLEPGRWQSDDSIGYLRTGSGNEIDFGPIPAPTSSGPRQTTPIESKWVSHGWRSEARTIEGKFNAGLVATRSELDFSSPAWAVPAPVLSPLLD